MVVLSDDGRLETCYLGSEPSLFTGPQAHRRGFDYMAAEQELRQLRQLARRNDVPGNGDIDFAMLEQLWVDFPILEQVSY